MTGVATFRFVVTNKIYNECKFFFPVLCRDLGPCYSEGRGSPHKLIYLSTFVQGDGRQCVPLLQQYINWVHTSDDRNLGTMWKLIMPWVVEGCGLFDH
jgi:hypothetical protein